MVINWYFASLYSVILAVCIFVSAYKGKDEKFCNYLLLLFLKSLNVGLNWDDPSTTRALDHCKKYILYPYYVLLIVVSIKLVILHRQ